MIHTTEATCRKNKRKCVVNTVVRLRKCFPVCVDVCRGQICILVVILLSFSLFVKNIGHDMYMFRNLPSMYFGLTVSWQTNFEFVLANFIIRVLSFFVKLYFAFVMNSSCIFGVAFWLNSCPKHIKIGDIYIFGLGYNILFEFQLN